MKIINYMGWSVQNETLYFASLKTESNQSTLQSKLDYLYIYIYNVCIYIVCVTEFEKRALMVQD